ncbi:MAG: ThiF family adenylyltransferase [Parvularcula sp.]|nr:ThiF family adenylyltransferase [Parvularcula sp.]
MTEPSLTITETMHKDILRDLFPGDGLETAGILLCRRVGLYGERLIGRSWRQVPPDTCRVRTVDRITWPGAALEDAIDEAEAESETIFLVHSHPGGDRRFSSIDDASDASTMSALHHGITAPFHGSAIVMPSGSMAARVYDSQHRMTAIKRVWRIGIDLTDLAALGHHPDMPFGEAMKKSLRNMTAAVIGVSGTGSIVAELLVRKGVGRVILIDFDRMELKNLNRILNSIRQDAIDNRLKTEMFAERAQAFGTGGSIVSIPRSVADKESVIAASSADILFSCVDRMDARHIAERISQFCLTPLVDVGVTIPTRTTSEGTKAIAEIAGRVDYVHPTGPSLSDRGVVTPDGLRREYLMDTAPDDATEQLARGYLPGIQEEAPAVMSVNMRAAATAVNEWLARLYGFRSDGNAAFARTLFLLVDGTEEYVHETGFPVGPSPIVACGLAHPLLGVPGLVIPSKGVAA